MPTARSNLAVATDTQRNIYAIGGYNSSFPVSDVTSPVLSTVEKYSPSTNTWTTVASMPTARYYLAAAPDTQGNIYAIGGYNSVSVPLSTSEKYLPSVTLYTFTKN